MRRPGGAPLVRGVASAPEAGGRELEYSVLRVRAGGGVGTGRPCASALAARSFCMRRSARVARERGRRPIVDTPLLAECLRAADDLHQLRGDRRLARSVVNERVFADHFGRLLGGGFHGRHARTELGGLRFVQRAQDRHLDVHRHEPLEQRPAVGLEQVLAVRRPLGLVCRGFTGLCRRLLQRNQRLRHDALAHRALELVVHYVDRIDLAVDERGQDLARDAASLLDVELLPNARQHFEHRRVATAEEVPALAADGDDLDGLASGLTLVPNFRCRAQDVRVERPAQTAIAGDDEQEHRLLRATRQQRTSAVREGAFFLASAAGNLAEHLSRLHGVRAEGLDTLLGAREPRACNHLLRARDLLRRFDARDTLADSLEVSQRGLLLARDELLAEGLEHVDELLLDLVGDLFLRADVFPKVGVLLVDEAVQLFLVAPQRLDG